MTHVATGHPALECTIERLGHCHWCDLIDRDGPNYREDMRRLFHPEEWPAPEPAPRQETAPGVPQTTATSPLAGIPLAGDIIEAIAKRVGAKRLALWWAEKTGMSCSCAERREAMNRATEKLLKWAGIK